MTFQFLGAMPSHTRIILKCQDWWNETTLPVWLCQLEVEGPVVDDAAVLLPLLDYDD